MAPLPTHQSFAETYRQSSDPGGDFHRFVGEFFAAETVGLTSFLAPGKDGAIDIYDLTHQGVYECKFVGGDGYDAIYPRWREVERHLTDNLLPNAPKTGASQYRPWYNTVQPIRHYHFCVSARFANKAQADQLVQQIRSAFNGLADRAGLAHMRNIAVEVWSWDRFEPVLSTRVGLRLRWLGRGLPNGVQEFSRAQERQRPGFQAYLHGNDKIKYVPIDDALAPAALLATIAAAEQASAVIHGRGGTGKSRLLIETGRAAQEAGWVVVQVQADTVAPESLATLVRECGEAPLLLLMDYVERCVNWDAWMFALQDFVGEGATVRLLGTCRDSWRERLDAYQSCLLRLPVALDTTVLGMLAQRPDLLPMAERCEGVPVFAAFLCLLYDTQQHAVLESLRGQTDFGRWLQQHIARLPVAPNVLPSVRESALVELLISLPCSDAALQALENVNPVAASYRAQLHEDGWLTHDMAAPEAECWSVVHDVLADGALCRWLGAQAQAADPYLQRWLNAARQRGSLPPILATLQRVAREPVVQAHPWHQIFEAKSGSPWLGWMDAILRTHLLTPLEALAWLDRFGGDPASNVGSRAVQIAVGDAIEQARKATAGGVLLANGQEACLCRWADAVAAALTGIGVPLAELTPNRVLTHALGWNPARYAAVSARWLDAHADQEQAQFLLNTWLEVGEPSCGRERARSWVERWLKLNGLGRVASFVFNAWLDVKGELELVRAPIQNWLAQEVNALSPAAQFVFKAWLDAKGDLAVVRDPIKNWLAREVYALSPTAQFVFKAWLDSKGDLALVRGPIKNWLMQKEYALSSEASYVFEGWLDAKGELDLVRESIRSWLAPEANALLHAAQFVFRAWLDAKGELELVRKPMQKWLTEPENALSPVAQFVFRAWLDAKGDLAEIDTAVKAWILIPENAKHESTGFVIRAYGNRDRHLPDWLVEPACAWVRAWHHHQDATYPLKYIASVPTLDVETLQAVLDWCQHYPRHEDALIRLSRALQALHLGELPDRVGLFEIGAQVIDAAVAQSAITGLSLFNLLAGLSSLAKLNRLPTRNAAERAAAQFLPSRVCALLRLIPDVGMRDFDTVYYFYSELFVSTDWEGLVERAVPPGIQLDQALKNGLRIWIDRCRSWAPTERHRNALDRLSKRAR